MPSRITAAHYMVAYNEYLLWRRASPVLAPSHAPNKGHVNVNTVLALHSCAMSESNISSDALKH